jgi:RNA polymerase sigma factor (TIGR02999 family)
VPDRKGEVTELLRQFRAGDAAATARLVAAVYDELRHVAARALRNERPGHTLQPTALVNEVFLRLVKSGGVDCHDRAHFFGIAAKLMRQILVDYARQHDAAKRGGAKVTIADEMFVSQNRLEDVIAWDHLLHRLEELDPRQSQIVELRFFAGLTVEEIAKAMGIAAPTVKREWASAKAWLHRELSLSASA